MGFHHIQSDHSIWIWHKGDTRIIILVFVDDMTIAAKDQASIDWVKSELKKRFKVHDLGPTSWLLGVEIQRDRSKRTLTLSQRQYTLDMLKHYNMSDATPVHTPMNPGVKLSTSMCPTTQEEKDDMACVPYANAVGALMWLAVATHPDIAYAVGVLFTLSTTEADFVAAMTAGQQIIWLHNLLWEFGYSFPTPPPYTLTTCLLFLLPRILSTLAA